MLIIIIKVKKQNFLIIWILQYVLLVNGSHISENSQKKETLTFVCFVTEFLKQNFEWKIINPYKGFIGDFRSIIISKVERIVLRN